MCGNLSTKDSGHVQRRMCLPEEHFLGGMESGWRRSDYADESDDQAVGHAIVSKQIFASYNMHLIGNAFAPARGLNGMDV